MVECTSNSSLKIFWKSYLVQKVHKATSIWLAVVNERVWRKGTREAHFRRQFEDKYQFTKELCIHVKWNPKVRWWTAVEQTTLMKKPQLSKVQSMLLVGGFVDSAFLQQELKTEFARRLRILAPHYKTIAVVKGAVIFGKKPTKISERVVSTTFGSDRSIDFIEGVHPEEKKFITNGIEKCGQVFKCFVRENSVVKLGERITKTYHPERTSATSLKFGFYVTSNPK